MKFSKSYIQNSIACLALVAVTVTSCKKDGNPNNLPGVDPSAYDGKIDGYNNTEEVFPENQIAYWSFDDTKNELKSGLAPFSSLNDSYVAAGVRGKALNLAAGFVYYKAQLGAFKTDSLKNWTVSAWVKVKNNASKRTMVFQIARPTIFNGNLNVALNTHSYPATNDSTLRLNPTFSTNNSITGGSMQDNLNNGAGQDKVNLNNGCTWCLRMITARVYLITGSME